MSAHRAFTRNIRRGRALFNMVDCIGFPALGKIRSVTVDKRAQLCTRIGSSPHIHTYPQALVHNLLCASRPPYLFASIPPFSGPQTPYLSVCNPGYATLGRDALVQLQQPSCCRLPGELLAERHGAV